MRTTLTRPTDYKHMIKIASEYPDSRAIDVIELFSVMRKVALHRAGKVFWQLCDEGKIICEKDLGGYECIKQVLA